MNGSSRARDLQFDTPWFLNPDRPCKGRPEFSDLSLVKPLGNLTRKTQIKRMVKECYSCPVLKECRIDLLASTKDWEHYGVRAGIVGKR